MIRRAGSDPSRVTSDESSRPDRPRRAGRDPSHVISNETTRPIMPRGYGCDPYVRSDEAARPDRPLRTHRDPSHVRSDTTALPDMPRSVSIDVSHTYKTGWNQPPRRDTNRRPRPIECTIERSRPCRHAATSQPTPNACYN